MSKPRITILAVLMLPLVAFGVITAAWAIDTRDSKDVIVRNVVLADQEIGGQSTDEAAEQIEELAENFASTRVTITAGDLELETTAAKLGMTVDVEGSVEQLAAIGKDDSGPAAPARWIKSFFSEREGELKLNIDENAALVELLALEGDSRTFPVEPQMDASEDGVVLVEGVTGTGLDLVDTIGQLPTSAAVIDGEITIESQVTDTPPTISDETAGSLVDQANEATSQPFTVIYGEESADIDAALLRPGFSFSDPADGDLTLELDEDLVKKVLDKSLEIDTNPTGVTFAMSESGPVAVPGTDATSCCDSNAPDDIVDALLAGKNSVEVDSTVITAEEGVEWANGLGITEVVGEFTTYHACCGSRVTNIHKISDTTRGVLIAPGETFSVNDFVGRRTPEKGYVSAGVIQDGEFVDDYGGGISQYATTLFNAAFFAGLEIPEYKAHSIYISRYPFGREATLSYPTVDLQIENNSPFGVVIWPEYTSTSITIKLWSTRNSWGDQTGQNKSSGCGFVSTERTRLFVDGTVDVDEFTASYDCDPPDQ